MNIKPTSGEKFKAKRRRDKLSQEELAKKIKVDRNTIKFWEDDGPVIPYVNIKLTEGELYFILRERLGLPLKKAADLMGISHVTLIKLEKLKGGQKILKEFYEKYLRKNNIKIGN